MIVKKLTPSGFCKGVVRAIEIAKQTREKNPNENIYILGMLVHNKYVIDDLNKLNIITLNDPNKSRIELLEQIESGIVIFTAHGISQKVIDRAIEKNLKYIDATCIDVLKTKQIILDYLNKNFDVIYLGIKNHPEAIAISSISNSIHLITSIEELQNLKIKNTNIVFLNQTTMSIYDLNKYHKLARVLFPTIILENEICKATTLRQKAVLELKDVDILFVVGDPKSNNTNKLAQIAIKNGIKNVYLISNKDEILNSYLYKGAKVYITAGASTPPYLINEVYEYLINYKFNF